MRRKGKHHRPGFLARHAILTVAFSLLLVSHGRHRHRHWKTSLLAD